MKATGKFEVKMSPLEGYAMGKGGVTLGRMSLDKTFEGDLEATSKGEMLSATSSIEGSAGYVAQEQVEGTLAGKRGSFVLQHVGTMHQGAFRLQVEVSPGSGAGELNGLRGTMVINVAGGQHDYEFDYELG